MWAGVITNASARVASMGPPLKAAENARTIVSPVAPTSALQWGRR